MFIVTNRAVRPNAKGLSRLGDEPNEKGPNELRLVEATKSGGAWKIDILPDTLDAKMKKEVGLAGAPDPVYASAYAARKILRRVRKEKKNLLFFVHGYNNNIEAVLNRAQGFEDRYGVEVIAFSWPANGGGVKGVVSYKADKRDARASIGGLDRALARMDELLRIFHEQLVEEIHALAKQKFPDDGEARDQYFAAELDKGCPFTINMALHSMGNYLYKCMLESSVYRGDLLLFDNVVMVAADTNNHDHATWVDRIRSRRRVYITINEDDSALMASRMKAGESQLARLGHFPHNLNSKQAVYVDFTSAPYVGKSHAYFEGTPLRNSAVRRFFREALNGERAEEKLTYLPARGAWRVD